MSNKWLGDTFVADDGEVLGKVTLLMGGTWVAEPPGSKHYYTNWQAKQAVEKHIAARGAQGDGNG